MEDDAEKNAVGMLSPMFKTNPNQFMIVDLPDRPVAQSEIRSYDPLACA